MWSFQTMANAMAMVADASMPVADWRPRVIELPPTMEKGSTEPESPAVEIGNVERLTEIDGIPPGRHLGQQISGDVLHNPGLGYAVAMGMVIIMGLSILFYSILQRRSERWLG